ncbi:MAG: hypothetical protein BZ135_09150 [Methanosphaera sp. rholeuAM6]|nr:MAG: hypothetical protein BZ135_09150 [Methanosphaera sp. rholeuAM6]
MVKIIYDKNLKTGIKRQGIINGVLLRVPPNTTDEFIIKRLKTPNYKDWILRCHHTQWEINHQDEKLRELGFELEDRSIDELREIIEKYVSKYEKEFIRPKISIKPIIGVWGRCSKSKDKLTFNPVMKYISEEFIEFIVYHEMVHTYCLNHNPPFYRKMEERYPDMKEMDKKLDYWSYLLERNEIFF